MIPNTTVTIKRDGQIVLYNGAALDRVDAIRDKPKIHVLPDGMYLEIAFTVEGIPPVQEGDALIEYDPYLSVVRPAAVIQVVEPAPSSESTTHLYTVRAIAGGAG